MTHSFIRISCSRTASVHSIAIRLSSSACESTQSQANTSHSQSQHQGEESCRQDGEMRTETESRTESERETSEDRRPSDRRPTTILLRLPHCRRRSTWMHVHRHTMVAMHVNTVCPSVWESSSRSMSARASAS